jgi:HK97 family phage portal protein
MGFLSSTWNVLTSPFKTFERKATTTTGDLSNPAFWLVDFFSGRKTLSGQRITPNSALTCSAYFAALRSISEDIAKLPIQVFRMSPDHDERTPLYDHPVYRLLNICPNDEMTAIVYRETMQHWAMGWGGAFAEIERNGRGEPVAKWPIHPSRVVIMRDKNNRIFYRIRGNYSADMLVESAPFKDVDLPAEDVFHLHGLGPMGNTGYSILRLAAESIGVALSAQTFGATFFGNGTNVNGILTHPGALTDVGYQRLRESWSQRYQGPQNANKPAILEEGMKWEPTSIPPEEAQFLETRQFQVEEIARWFRMPPHKLQQLLRATFSNIESQNIEYADDCLSPWTVRWNQETKRKLFGINDSLVYCEHDMRQLKRADMATRTKYYQARFACGSISPDEIRAAEGENPIPDGSGKKYFVQINLASLENAGELPEPGAVGPDGKPLKQVTGSIKNEDDEENDMKAYAVKLLSNRNSLKLLNGAVKNGQHTQS